MDHASSGWAELLGEAHERGVTCTVRQHRPFGRRCPRCVEQLAQPLRSGSNGGATVRAPASRSSYRVDRRRRARRRSAARGDHRACGYSLAFGCLRDHNLRPRVGQNETTLIIVRRALIGTLTIRPAMPKSHSMYSSRFFIKMPPALRFGSEPLQRVGSRAERSLLTKRKRTIPSTTRWRP